MRQSRAKSLRRQVYKECDRRRIQGMYGRKQVFRRMKKTYNRVPRTEREHYSIYK